MAAPHWLERLRQKWKIDSIWQVVIILVVFACTGFTVLFIKKPLLQFLAGSKGDTVLASILYYVFILPIYNVLLLGMDLYSGSSDSSGNLRSGPLTDCSEKNKFNLYEKHLSDHHRGDLPCLLCES